MQPIRKIKKTSPSQILTTTAMKHRINAGTSTSKFAEEVAQAPAFSLPAGEGVAEICEAEDVLEWLEAVMFVARFVPVFTSVTGMKSVDKDWG
jgi:hypothetical protein